MSLSINTNKNETHEIKVSVAVSAQYVAIVENQAPSSYRTSNVHQTFSVVTYLKIKRLLKADLNTNEPFSRWSTPSLLSKPQ